MTISAPSADRTAGARIDLPTRLSYGVGAVAYGVKDNGFSYFLLFFYSQVMGVPAGLAGMAIFIALLFDAVSDPLVGSISDRLHSRWGRRHPFMYASALPVAITFYLLWNPPSSLSGADLFPYLLVLAILLRLSITLYEIPSTALVSDMSEDYDERTSLLSYRYFFQWCGGLLVSFLMYRYLLAPTEAVPNGFFNIQGYATYGWIGAGLMFLSITISCLGTHHLIPRLNAPPPKRALSLRRTLTELWETLSNRSFVAIFMTTMILGMGSGIAAALVIYFNNYFWELTPQQVAIIVLCGFLSAPLAFYMAPRASRIWEKKTAALLVAGTAFFIAPLPIILRLIGVFPANDSPIFFPLYVAIIAFDLALVIAAQILISSMVADIPEDSEIVTGRRSEGVFFAAQTFARKAVSGLGVLVAGVLLDVANFPRDAGATPDIEAATQLALFYVPTMLLVYAAGLFALSFYRIRKADHLNNLEILKARRADALSDGGGAQ